MKYLAVLVLVVLTSPPSLAQNSKKYDACMAKANTQSEMDACANEEAERVEADRMKLYGSLVSARKGRPEALAKLKAAEEAWADTAMPI